MRSRSSLHLYLSGWVALFMLLGGFSLEAAPRSSKKRSKKVSVSPLVDLDGILDKDKKKKKEKARPRSMGELLDSRQLVALVDAKLDEEISLAKQLIGFDKTCEGASPVRFRLGDLYWEKSKRAFFESQDLDRKKRDRQAAQKKMGDYQKQTLKWYREILDLCPQYEATPKVLYYLGRVYVELGKAKAGARYFKRIIQEHLDSEWSGKS